MRHPFRSQGNQENPRAAAAVMTVATLIVLLGFASLTIDVGYLYAVRLDMQNAVDAAALAGASALDFGEQGVRERIEQIVDTYRVDGKPLPLENSDIILGFWDAQSAKFTPATGDEGKTPDAVRVIGNLSSERGNPVSLFFAPLLGHNTSNIRATATASFGTAQPWHVVITQDVTSSFTDELDEARQADQALLDCLFEHTSEESLVGIVGFTGFGGVVSPLKLLGENYAELSTSISNTKVCGSKGMPTCSGTNIGAGLDEAIGLLKDLETDYPRAIIVVSDGMPNSSLPGYTNADLEEWAINSADEADALGISVFILFYGGNDTTPNADEFLAGLTRGQGTAHIAVEPEDMETALNEMCREGLPLTLVE